METVVQSSQKVDWCSDITIMLSILIKHVMKVINQQIFNN